MKPNIKKLLILNAPYLLFVYLFDKVGQAVRLSPGAGLSGKLLSIGSGFSAAFSNALPSFAPMDLLIGIVGAVVIRLAVYVKGKNAKKYRKGMEYGSARWGNAEDIKPYIDPMFENNVLLTQTERLMMSSRPKHPKYARNKNVLVIGGSGSGKTRFFVKPNLMQMHSSYVVTDPTPAWNGAPVSCPGATGKWDFPSRALPPASRRVFRGLPLTGNGARGAMRTLPPVTLSFLTGI